MLDLTTTGRKSGQPRTTHLIAMPYGDNLALLGTNFGQERTPAWVLNLEADPRATVSYRGPDRDVVARPATEDERARSCALARRSTSATPTTGSGSAGRRIRVFVLEPVG